MCWWRFCSQLDCEPIYVWICQSACNSWSYGLVAHRLGLFWPCFLFWIRCVCGRDPRHRARRDRCIFETGGGCSSGWHGWFPDWLYHAKLQRYIFRNAQYCHIDGVVWHRGENRVLRFNRWFCYINVYNTGVRS